MTKEEIPYQTDKQIKDETDELLLDCFNWAKNNFKEELPSGRNWTSEDIRSIAITRFIYLNAKLLNHSPKYYRDKELDNRGFNKEPIIRKDKKEG